MVNISFSMNTTFFLNLASTLVLKLILSFAEAATSEWMLLIEKITSWYFFDKITFKVTNEHYSITDILSK